MNRWLMKQVNRTVQMVAGVIESIGLLLEQGNVSERRKGGLALAKQLPNMWTETNK